ncbi:MAG: hypothetical protein LUD47_07615 [Clostridia bacterium]|nr:hypothetical protein [Clostridia bacterium]
MATVKNMTGKTIVIGKPHGLQPNIIEANAEVELDDVNVLSSISKVDSRLYVHKDASESKAAKTAKRTSKKTADTTDTEETDTAEVTEA